MFFFVKQYRILHCARGKDLGLCYRRVTVAPAQMDDLTDVTLRHVDQVINQDVEMQAS
jgi:hypothetical protein